MARRRRRRSGFGILFKIPKSAYQKAAKKVAAADRVFKRWRGKGGVPSELLKGKGTNRDRAVVEVYRFQNRTKATPFTAYMKGAKITNFTGLRLCTVVHRTGKKGVTARCIDGRTYVGRSNGDGMWISMRPKAGG